jgi:protocatechuate 3,4-dioxygenase beta subunit
MYDMKTIKGLLLAGVFGLAGLLAGCGGGGASGSSDDTDGSGGGSSAEASLTLTMTDPSTGNESNSLASGSPLTLTALVRDSDGAVVPNAVVTFTTDAEYGVFSPSSGTALTNASGIASLTLSAGVNTGAATVTATATAGTEAVSQNAGYSVNVAALGLSSLTFGASPLSAYGTTSVTVNVTSGGAPYTTPVDVFFTSTCAASTPSKAELPASVRSVNGVATASYRDLGCGANDVVTASLSGGASSNATLVVSSPSLSSIRFVSADPTSISVQGMGGTEVSTVKFEVLDSGGTPISGQEVEFSLNTTVGGLDLTADTAVSNALGEVVTLVVSGTVPTPVRVTASTTGATVVTSQSSQLYVSTMIPDQSHFSLSAEKLYLEALNTDGVTTSVTARLADRAGNPVPDNTAVVFTTEGGSIVSGCLTTNGVCTVTWTSQNPRPSNGRSTVLAYAVGEESYTDLNGNGRYDAGEPFGDLGEAFRDDDEDGIRDAGSEIFVDFNSNGSYSAAGDAAFTGVLCNSGCSVSANNVNVRDSLVLTFSGSTPILPIISPGSIDLGGCGAGAPGSIHSATLTVVDVNGNSLPSGTTISATTTNGVLVGVSSFTVPATGATSFTVNIQNDSTGTPCADSTPSGTLTVTTSTPASIVTSDVIPVSN